MGSAQERAAERRQAKLDAISEQVRSGALVIRQMTPAERAKWAKERALRLGNLTNAERTRFESTLQSRRQRIARSGKPAE